MAEKIADLGYCLVGKQTAADTAVTPSVQIPLVSKDIYTDMNFDDEIAILGNRAARQALIGGQRMHQGSIEALAEPNTIAYLVAMLLKKGTTTGGGPYTHPFTVDEPANSWTFDFAANDMVQRFWGVKAGNMSASFNDNKMHVNMDISALGSFITREISSTSGASSPYTISLKTNYDENPTKGLVASDVMRAYDVSEGTFVDFAVQGITDETDITTTTDITALEDGDIIFLRKQTPSNSLLYPFTFSRTEFCFADTAANALSATHTPLETGSTFSIDFPLVNAGGEHRSGAKDPSALVKGLIDAEVNVLKTFMKENADVLDTNRFLTIGDRALVIRCYSEAVSGTNTELRLTLNTVNWRENPIQMDAGELVIAEGVMVPSYNKTDGQVLDVKVINNVSSI